MVKVARLPVCRNHPDRPAPARGKYAYRCAECRTGPTLAAVPDPVPTLDVRGADAGWLAVHEELRGLHVEKSSTYGHDADRLANFTGIAAITGDPAELGALLRIIEKSIRALNMIRAGDADAVREYRDLASLAIICETLLRRRR